MAKARACSKCGTWYKPKFGGDFEQCYGCTIKEKLGTSDTPTKQ